MTDKVSMTPSLDKEGLRAAAKINYERRTALTFNVAKAGDYHHPRHGERSCTWDEIGETLQQREITATSEAITAYLVVVGGQGAAARVARNEGWDSIDTCPIAEGSGLRVWVWSITEGVRDTFADGGWWRYELERNPTSKLIPRFWKPYIVPAPPSCGAAEQGDAAIPETLDGSRPPELGKEVMPHAPDDASLARTRHDTSTPQVIPGGEGIPVPAHEVINMFHRARLDMLGKSGDGDIAEGAGLAAVVKAIERATFLQAAEWHNKQAEINLERANHTGNSLQNIRFLRAEAEQHRGYAHYFQALSEGKPEA